MARFAIAPRTLQWAISRSGLMRETLEHRFPMLNAWESGDRQPTIRQLEALAKATLTPMGYLLLEEPPIQRLPIPHFRTFAEATVFQPSAELLQTVYTVEQRQAWYREFILTKNAHPLPFVGQYRATDDPVEIASAIRRELGLDHGWAATHRTWREALRSLFDIVDDCGILITANGVLGNKTRRRLDPQEFRGFVLIDPYAPSIFVNNADSKSAQMFTIAHELAHIWLGASASFDLREMMPANVEVERACNIVAAEMLVPRSELQNLWQETNEDLNRFQRIARHFKVSEIVVARRSLDLQFISRDEFFAFYNEYMARERAIAPTGSEGGDFLALQYFRIGRRFGRAVVSAARNGEELYSNAFRLTGLHGNTFEDFASDTLGLGRSE